MPWCPKCKTEYQEGFTVCSDCKIDLVEELPEETNFIPFFQADNKMIADKLVKYFNYSELKTELQYDETNQVYIISVPAKKEKQAKKLYQAFYFVERERLANSKLTHSSTTSSDENNGSDNDEIGVDISDDNNEADDSTNTVPDDMVAESSPLPYEEASASSLDEFAYDAEIPEADDTGMDDNQSSSSYVMKADQYKDLAGTVWVFLFFGIAGLIFVILNLVGILSLFKGWIPNLVLGALFLFFLYIAISTQKKAKSIQAEIEAEEKLTEEINSWLEQNLNESFIQSLRDENISDELNYIKLTDTVKEMLINEFGSQNLAYLDRLIEEFYNKTYDTPEK